MVYNVPQYRSSCRARVAMQRTDNIPVSTGIGLEILGVVKPEPYLSLDSISTWARMRGIRRRLIEARHPLRSVCQSSISGWSRSAMFCIPLHDDVAYPMRGLVIGDRIVTENSSVDCLWNARGNWFVLRNRQSEQIDRNIETSWSCESEVAATYSR